MTTAMTAALGQMPNAPLVLVLAQVRFLPSSQANSLDVLRDRVCEQLGNDFPNATPIFAFNIQITNTDGLTVQPQGQQTLMGFDLRSADQRSVVRMNMDSLTLAVNTYIDFEHFMVTWSRVLSALSQAGISAVQRVGLRYVDFIYASEGHVPEEYVVPPFDFRVHPPMPGAKGHAQTSMQMQEYEFNEGRMRLQYARGIGNASLPADLQGLIEVASVHARPNFTHASAILDTDRWADGRRSAELSGLQKTFRLLHTDVSEAFKKCTTPMAIAEWTKPRSDAP